MKADIFFIYQDNKKNFWGLKASSEIFHSENHTSKNNCRKREARTIAIFKSN